MHSASEPFTCLQCGECCKGYGGTILSSADIPSVADYLGIPHQVFLKRYCTFSGKRPLLKQRPDGYCVFFTYNCSIHPVKPRMCREWPYIDSLLVDIGNWHIMAGFCPGMRQDLDEAELLRAVKAKLAARRNGCLKGDASHRQNNDRGF